jgi:hypothetical protein
MPIQILDNFEVNIAKPIDNRFVVGSQSFYTNKEQIPYRYPGLRIWDLNDNFPYIWTGVTWSNENQSGSVIGSGIVNRLARFTGTNNIGSSIVFDNGTSIAIDSTTPLTTDKLFINGNGRNVRLSGTGSFIGNGSGLTTLNATNITSGSLSLTRITDGSSGQILVRGLSNAEFVNASSITVGTASTLTINPASDSAIYHFPFFSGTTGLPINKQIFATSSSIQIRPNTGNVGIGTSPSTTNRLTVSGTVSITGNVGIGTPLTTNILTVSGTVSVSGATRVNRLGNTGLPGFVHGYNTSAINFETFATSTSTEISIYNPSNTNFKTRILQYPNYFELLTSERMFFTVSNSGARDFFFGREGQPTTQIRFIMDNSPDDIPNFIGKGVFINQNLRVNGRISVGDVSGSGVALYRNASDGSLTVTSSDIRLKDNITYIENSIDIVKQLRGVFFNWKDNVGFDTNERQIGMIAQEVEDVFPEAVVLNGVDDYKTIKYSEMVGLLINAIKEQQSIIEDLTKRIEDLES